MKCLEDLVSIHLVPRQDLTKEHPIDAQDQCLSDRLVRNTGSSNFSTALHQPRWRKPSAGRSQLEVELEFSDEKVATGVGRLGDCRRQRVEWRCARSHRRAGPFKMCVRGR